jgi:phosphopantetheine--protein transferase-like protein
MIGIDLVSIPEFQRQLEIGGTRFLQRAFSKSELENRDVRHLAGLWAAKEAVIKAAVTPPQLSDIELTHDASGRPHARVGAQSFDVSISHHGEYAVAVAMSVSA